MLRQCILERAGWRFWRCFASTFVLHKDDVIRNLIETLEANDIHPCSVDAPITSIHVESRQVIAFLEDQSNTVEEIFDTTDNDGNMKSDVIIIDVLKEIQELNI